MPVRDEDQWSMSSSQMEARIAMLMGGRAAEEIIFGMFYTGAMADIQQATRLARMMVTQFGMSEKLGPRAYGAGSTPVFMGRDLGESRDYSEEYAEQIDNEVKHILETAYQRAKVILNDNRDTIENLVNILMERETLDRSEFTDIMNGNYKLPSFES
jgi:cell division protease FtsH